MSTLTPSPQAIAAAAQWLREQCKLGSTVQREHHTLPLAAFLDAHVATKVKEIAAWVRDQDPMCESDGELSAPYMADEIERRWGRP